MGLKGYRLLGMGQLDSNVQSPTGSDMNVWYFSGVHRRVAVQVAFERQTLKPAFHLIGDRLWV
jgi:hypothetical protein